MADRARQATGQPSRRARAPGRRAAAPDTQRRREQASATGRRRSTSSGSTKGRPPRAATKTAAAAGKRAIGGRSRGATKPRTGPTGNTPPGRERQRGAAPADLGHGLLMELWRSLQMWLRRLERKLKRALATPQARRILTALLTRRLPGPLRVLLQGLGDPDERGFLFWWLVVTLVVTLAVALLLSIVLAPVAGIVALVGVGVWMLIRQGRQPAAQRA